MILILNYPSFSSISVIGESLKQLIKYMGKINVVTQCNFQTTNNILSLKSTNQDEPKTIFIILEYLFFNLAAEIYLRETSVLNIQSRPLLLTSTQHLNKPNTYNLRSSYEKKIAKKLLCLLARIKMI